MAPTPTAHRLVFLHIPKCGGTSFHNALAASFPPEEHCPERLRFLDRLTQEELERYRFYSGHYFWDQIQRVPDACTITLLREPRARLLSLYRFFRSHTWQQISYCESIGVDSPRMAKELDLADYLQVDDPIARMYTDNAITRHLIGRKHYDSAGRCLLPPVAAANLAVENLLSMQAFGVLEHYAESRPALMHATGIALPASLPRDNSVEENIAAGLLEHVSIPEPDESTESLIHTATSIDRHVYEAATAIILKRSAQSTDA